MSDKNINLQNNIWDRLTTRFGTIKFLEKKKKKKTVKTSV